MGVYITGYGAISAIGLTAEENFSSLIKKKTGIKKGIQADGRAYFCGQVPFTNAELADRFQLKNHLSRTALLGIIAAKESFEGHQLSEGIRTGLISGTSVGGMDLSEIEYKNYLAGEKHQIETYAAHPNGNSTEMIAQALGIADFVNTISTACSSSANSIMAAARLIEAGVLDRVIAGGTDSLTIFTISGFKSLMIYDQEWCRPFDQTRSGLNLGEGAAYLVLESEKSMHQTKKQPLAKLTGWSNASDAYHQTASSPEGTGATLSMQNALEKAQLSPEEISYINAHGTATPNNDLSESKALINVFKEKLPPFSSTKSFTGHTLAAAGGLEAVYAVLSILHKKVFPNLNFTQKIEDTQLSPLIDVTDIADMQHVLSNSFGFSGNNTTLIFSAC